MSFTLGLFVGFCLGVLCMALLFQAKASDAPTAPVSPNPVEQEESPNPMANPSKAPSQPLAKD